MAYQYYNRYSDFIINGEQTVVPFVYITPKVTDKNYIYKIAQSRLDKVFECSNNNNTLSFLTKEDIEWVNEILAYHK